MSVPSERGGSGWGRRQAHSPIHQLTIPSAQHPYSKTLCPWVTFYCIEVFLWERLMRSLKNNSMSSTETNRLESRGLGQLWVWEYSTRLAVFINLKCRHQAMESGLFLLSFNVHCRWTCQKRMKSQSPTGASNHTEVMHKSSDVEAGW